MYLLDNLSDVTEQKYATDKLQLNYQKSYGIFESSFVEAMSSLELASYT